MICRDTSKQLGCISHFSVFKSFHLQEFLSSGAIFQWKKTFVLWTRDLNENPCFQIKRKPSYKILEVHVLRGLLNFFISFIHIYFHFYFILSSNVIHLYISRLMMIVSSFTRMMNCFMGNKWNQGLIQVVINVKKMKVDMRKYGLEFAKLFGHEFGKAINNKKIEKLKLKASNDQKKVNALTYLLVVSCIFFVIMYEYM